MIWIEQGAHRRATDSRHVYIAVIDSEYVAFITCTPEGYRAEVPNPVMPVFPKAKRPADYYYTADTLDEAKEWCIAELWKRRLT